VVVGGGPLESALRTEAASRGLEERVLFTGERADIGDLLQAMDVFLLTSDREGLCNAVMEAMDCRLPCVVTDVGGNRELVDDGETGYVCANTSMLIDRVLRVLDDSLLRTRLGQAALVRMRERFGAERAARETEALYHRLLRGEQPVSAVAQGPDSLRTRSAEGFGEPVSGSPSGKDRR
jgi:glycosyltransferase involved in cell wall biosynthesis